MQLRELIVSAFDSMKERPRYMELWLMQRHTAACRDCRPSNDVREFHTHIGMVVIMSKQSEKHSQWKGVMADVMSIGIDASLLDVVAYLHRTSCYQEQHNTKRRASWKGEWLIS